LFCDYSIVTNYKDLNKELTPIRKKTNKWTYKWFWSKWNSKIYFRKFL